MSLTKHSTVTTTLLQGGRVLKVPPGQEYLLRVPQKIGVALTLLAG